MLGQAPTPLDVVTAALLRSASKLPFPERVRRQAALNALRNPAIVEQVMRQETGRTMTGAERSEIARVARQPPSFAKGNGAPSPSPSRPLHSVQGIF